MECERYKAKAIRPLNFMKWQRGFVTMGSTLLAHASTQELTITRALGKGSFNDESKIMPLACCIAKPHPHEGRSHVLSVSFPNTGLPEQFFSFATPDVRDSFMLKLQAKCKALKASAAAASPVPVSLHPNLGAGIAKITSHDIKINQSIQAKRGGGGTVYQVSWNGRQYAMKKPHFVGEMTEHDEAKFLKEMQNQACLQHPNCVPVYAYCLEKNNVFMIMEWMHGGSLAEMLRQKQDGALKGSALSARKRLAITRDVCCGLQYMHSKGMVHGDIKSLNVLLDLEVKAARLCDFGLTTMGLTASLMTRSLEGTVAWSAPEILCKGQLRTPQTDIYALGVLMWELLTSAQPFEGLASDQIIGLLMTSQRPPVPNPIPSGFPLAYATIMTHCWDQDPAKRPSAAEVHRCMMDLDPSTHPNEPVELYPPAFCWNSHEKSILPCLLRASSPCCHPMLQASVRAAYSHTESQSVLQLMASLGLTPLEAQSVFIYTADSSTNCHTHGAMYRSYNTALRDKFVYREVNLWSSYSFLFHNALLKLPSLACVVYRGLDVPLTDISHLYWEGQYVWLRSPTSTTTDKIGTMKKFGQATRGGVGTFMELRVKNAKDIEHFSAFPTECERLIPHNTCVKVLGAFSAARVRLLEGFGALPPNVDLVIVEEVRITVANTC